MCCAEFVVKYVLFFFNLVVSLAGLALIVLGIVTIYQVSDIIELIPVNINAIPITVIVIGCVIFVIAFSGCWGAIQETRGWLILYAVFMVIIAGVNIWLAVVIFDHLDNLQSTVEDWVNTAFANTNLRETFNVLEATFECCGTTGANSYTNQLVPGTCCGLTVADSCTNLTTYGGCTDRLGSFFETWGEAFAGLIIALIIVELVAMIFALFLNQKITNKRRSGYF